MLGWTEWEQVTSWRKRDSISTASTDIVSRRVSPDATSARRQDFARAFRDLSHQEGVPPAVLLPQVLDTANQCDIAMRIFHGFITQVFPIFVVSCLLLVYGDCKARIIFAFTVYFALFYEALLRCAYEAWPTIPFDRHRGYRSRFSRELASTGLRFMYLHCILDTAINVAIRTSTKPTPPWLFFMSALVALLLDPVWAFYGYKQSWANRQQVQGHPDEDIVAFFSLDGADEMIRLMRCSRYWIALRLVSGLRLHSVCYLLRNIVASVLDPDLSVWCNIVFPQLAFIYLAHIPARFFESMSEYMSEVRVGGSA